jgi:uncharacterized protein YggE
VTGMRRPPSITVTGRATRRVVPGIATWSATVEGRDATQREAFAACSATLSELTTAVAGKESGGAEVSAGGIFVHPSGTSAASGGSATSPVRR